MRFLCVSVFVACQARLTLLCLFHPAVGMLADVCMLLRYTAVPLLLLLLLSSVRVISSAPCS